MKASREPQSFDEFVTAQAAVYEKVRAELKLRRKQSHWMWYIFPQIAGLGHSDMAQRFSLQSPDDARNYLRHPVLGMRLRECTGLVMDAPNRSAAEIFGAPDDLKFRSCMTLFSMAAPDEVLFGAAIERYFDGKLDPLTVAILRRLDSHLPPSL